LSPISILPARIALLICDVFLHSLHLYSIVILFVVFVFLFHFATGGFEPHFPCEPLPDRTPRASALIIEPRDSGLVAPLDFCFAVPTLCFVCFLHFLQYLFVSLGSFMIRVVCRWAQHVY